MTSSPAPRPLNPRDITTAYTFLRVIIGICYFNIGFNRIGNMSGFVDGMVQMFADTYMPTFLVQINAFLVTPIELIAGLLLIFGLFTRAALIALLAVMVVLIYGVTLVQNSDLANSQLMYDLLLCILLAGLRFNTFSLDGWWQRQRQGAATLPQESTPVAPFSWLPGSARRRRRLHLGR